MFDKIILIMLGEGLLETLYMVFASTFIAYLIGIPIGITLVVTDKDGILPCLIVNKILGVVVNIIRSVPFIILLITVQPFTRAIIKTSIGPSAVVIPLIISAAPYIARLIEASLKEVDSGVIEAAKSMGASNFKIIYKVLVPEAMPSLIIGSAIATTTILGYSTMAGFVGGGGLGDMAIRYGYYRYEADVMYITVIILIIIVQIIQEISLRWMKSSDKRV